MMTQFVKRMFVKSSILLGTAGIMLSPMITMAGGNIGYDEATPTAETAPDANDANATSASPTRSGSFYARAQAGYGMLPGKFFKSQTTKDKDGKGLLEVKQSHFLGRLAVGYQFNLMKQFKLAVELGAFNLPAVTQEALQGAKGSFFGKVIFPKGTKVKIHMYGFDLMARGIIPITDAFYGFAGVGIAMIHSSLKLETSIEKGNPFFQEEHTFKFTGSALVPKVAVGVGYRVMDNVDVGLSYSYIMKSKFKGEYQLDGKTPSKKAEMDMDRSGIHSILLGVTYHF